MEICQRLGRNATPLTPVLIVFYSLPFTVRCFGEVSGMCSALRMALGHETLNQLLDLCGKSSHLSLLLPAAGALELRLLLCHHYCFCHLINRQLSILVSGTTHHSMDVLQTNTLKLFLTSITRNSGLNLLCV